MWSRRGSDQHFRFVEKGGLPVNLRPQIQKLLAFRLAWGFRRKRVNPLRAGVIYAAPGLSASGCATVYSRHVRSLGIPKETILVAAKQIEGASVQRRLGLVENENPSLAAELDQRPAPGEDDQDRRQERKK